MNADNHLIIVKFDTDTLPPILNALETDNGGNKLVLEVAVSFGYKNGLQKYKSNIQ